MDKLIITKSLRAFYKNPLQIAHKVLADRMGKRDPGNKPSSGDRIPFVYIQTKKKVKLQGDKVEHPDYIRENKLKPDYAHYITNQIMKPVQQVFALVLEDIPAYKNKKIELKMQIKRIKKNYKDDIKKQQEYEMKLRNKEVKKLIFDEALTKCMNAKNNQRDLMSFFQ
jgi:DNA polymerase elongation subunit (family B)